MATAAGITVRVSAGLLVALVVAAVAADAWARRDRKRAVTDGVSVLVYLAVASALTIALWPFLWENPIARFYEATKVMSNFDKGPANVLHGGRVIPVTDLPWHYLPVWIGITTPPAYLALALAGVASVRIRVRAFRERQRERFMLLYLAWLLIPLAGVAILRPPLYDEWRQALFVYPAIVIFAVAGARAIARTIGRSRYKRQLARAGATVLAASLVWGFGALVRLHPYQVAYFNFLAGDAPHERFEADYWGVSYREGLDRLLNAEPGAVDLYVCSGPGRETIEMIEPERAERVRYVGTVGEARYTLCAPRASVGTWDPGGELIFTIERDGIPLLVAHRRY